MKKFYLQILLLAGASFAARAATGDLTARQEAQHFLQPKSKAIATVSQSNVTHLSSPYKALGELPDIYGSVIYSTSMVNGSTAPGIYKVDRTPQLMFEGPEALMGGVLVDEIYYSVYFANQGGLISFSASSWDINTGEKTGEWYPDQYSVCAPGGMVLDPTTSTIYGLTYNSSMSGIQLSIIDFTDKGPTTTLVKALAGNWNSLAVDAAGQLYGISYTGHRNDAGDFIVDSSTLNKIDKLTGEVTAIGETGYKPAYLSSAIIDPKSGRMFWNVNEADGESYMCEVNLSTGKATLLYQLPGEDEIMGMYILPEAADNAPAACKDITYSFPQGSLSGTFTLTTPSALFDGSAHSTGNLTVHISANGIEVAKQTAQWGTTVTIPVDMSKDGAGLYDFRIYASNDAGAGEVTILRKVWIGTDTPEAPNAKLSYADGKATVTWDEVVGTVNGGWLDAANLTYSVTRNDGTVVAEGLKATTFQEELSDDGAIREVYYIVKAHTRALVSPEGMTGTVIIGAINPPYTSNFSNDGFTGWTIVNANNDDQTWMVMYDGSAGIRYNKELGGDDWLISPRVKLKAGRAYNISFEARAYNKNYTETLEVKVGTAPDATEMKTTAIAPTDFNGNTWTTADGIFAPPADGYYYIGVHDISNGATSYYTYMRNLTIVEGASAAVPAAVSNLKAVPDISGKFNVDISFNAPEKDLAGVSINDIEKIELYRFGTLIKTFESPQPGEQISYTDNLPGAGEVTYTVYSYNDNGRSPEASVSAIVGFDAPLPVAQVTLERTDVTGQIIATWDEVSADVNGKKFAPGDVTYTIKALKDESMKTVATGLTTLSYTYQAASPGTQEMAQFTVFAVADGVMSEGTTSGMEPVGTPYDGINEGFANAQTHYIWGYRPIADGAVELWDDNEDPDIQSITGDNGLIGIASKDFGGVTIVSGMVSLKSIFDPVLSFYTFNLDNSPDDPAWADNNAVIVTLKTVDGTQVSGYSTILDSTVNEVCNREMGWHQVIIPLDAYADKTIIFELSGITRSFIYTIFDDLYVGPRTPSGVSSIAGDETAINVNGGNITISNSTGKHVSVYTINGMVMYDGVTTGTTVTVAQGVYIVKVDGTATKVMVK